MCALPFLINNRLFLLILLIIIFLLDVTKLKPQEPSPWFLTLTIICHGLFDAHPETARTVPLVALYMVYCKMQKPADNPKIICRENTYRYFIPSGTTPNNDIAPYPNLITVLGNLLAHQQLSTDKIQHKFCPH